MPGSDESRFAVRIQGAGGTSNLGGAPSRVSALGTSPAEITHVVATYGTGGTGLYVNGEPFSLSSAAETTDFSGWVSSYPIVLGREPSLPNRGFLGTYHLMAFYDRELSPAEVSTNFEAGPGHDLPVRARDHLVVQYRFLEDGGANVLDLASQKFPLTIDDTSTYEWRPTGLAFTAPSVGAHASTLAVGEELACEASDAVTVEGWVSSASLSQGGPARVFTWEDPSGSVDANLSLVQDDTDGAQWAFRARTTSSQPDGAPQRRPQSEQITVDKKTHFVGVQTAGGSTIYLDGQAVPSVNSSVDGELNFAGDYAFGVGNTTGYIDGTRSWIGELHYVALYCRALTADEVADHYALGDGH